MPVKDFVFFHTPPDVNHLRESNDQIIQYILVILVSETSFT